MATNWPPPTAPSWPPPGYSNLQADSYETALEWLAKLGATTAQPNGQERAAFFTNARCGDDHTVTGIMVVWPGTGVRYPFARCDVDHPWWPSGVRREGLVLWPPYTAIV